VEQPEGIVKDPGKKTAISPYEDFFQEFGRISGRVAAGNRAFRYNKTEGKPPVSPLFYSASIPCANQNRKAVLVMQTSRFFPQNLPLFRGGLPEAFPGFGVF
jgi:hypothetical protein